MTRWRSAAGRGSAALLAALVAVPLVGSGPAEALTDEWASWTPIRGTSNDFRFEMQQSAAGFPVASVASDSRATVQLPGGTATFLGASTPPGAKYGSSRGSSYVVLRPRADNATSPSTTRYTFERLTPETGWAFVLGDVDSDQVEVRARDADGDPVGEGEIDSWFRGVFNHAGAADLPRWDDGSSTLVGNPGALDTEGASGWFEPDVRLSSLTLVFTRRAGFPVYQTWFVSRARPIGGTVSSTPAPACRVQDSVLTLVAPGGARLATTSPDATGAYAFGEYATQSGYTVRVTPPEGCVVVGPTAAAVDNRGNDGDPASRADFTVREIVPQPISGTVTDDDGQPVAGVTVTLTAPDETTTSVTTGADGGYLFDGNPVADGYRLSVAVPEGYAAGPGGTEITGIAVDDEPITDQDFVLRELASVSGRVTGGGSGLGGVRVVLEPVGGGPTLSTLTRGDGSYTLPGVAPGEYVLVVDPPEGYAGDLRREITVGDDDLARQDVALSRAGAAGGTVTDEDGGVGGVVVELDGPGPAVETTTDDAGDWFVDDLPSGSWTATVVPPQGYAVDGADTLAFTLTDAGEVVGDLDFALVAEAAPTPTPTPSPTAPAPASPTPPTTGPSATGIPAASTTGSLPGTGGPPVSLLALAGGLLLTGGVLLRPARPGTPGASRRRR